MKKKVFKLFSDPSLNNAVYETPLHIKIVAISLKTDCPCSLRINLTILSPIE